MVSSLKDIFLMFLFSLIFYSSTCQNILKHFTIEDGLPSDEVHFVHQDKRGYFWFCTDRGISRYNGYEFINFTTADGLSSNVVFKCFEDWEGKLWFTCIDGSITIYDYNLRCFKDYEHNDWLKTKFKKQSWVHNIGFRKEKKEVYFFMLINNPNSDIYKIDSLGNKNSISKNEYLLQNEMTYDNLQVIGLTKIYFWKVVYSRSNVDLDNYFDPSNLVTRLDPYPSSHHIDSSIFICSNSGFFKLGNKGQSTNLMDDISATASIKDREGLFWISSKNGIYVMSNELIKKIDFKIHLNSGEQLTTGKSLKEGLVLGLNPSKFIVLNLIDESVQKFESNYKFDKFGGTFYNEDSTGVNFGNKMIKYSEDKPHYALTNSEVIDYGEFRINVDGKFYNHNEIPLGHKINSKKILSNYSLFLGHDFAEWLIRNERNYVEVTRANRGLVHQYFFHKDYVYIGSWTGLLKFYADGRETETVDLGEKYNSISITDLDTIQGITILATKGRGVLGVLDDKVVNNLGLENGLLSAVVNSTYVFRNTKEIWCGTDKGISVFEYSFKSDSLRFDWKKNIRRMDGLFSQYINDIEFVHDRVLALSNYGISSIPKDFSPVRGIMPKVSLLGYVNGDSTYFKNDEIFSFNQNNIEFHYELVSMRKTKNTYRYRLVEDSDDTKWTLTDDRSIRIDNISSGSYIFQICARIADGEWSVPVGYTFTIKQRLIYIWWIQGLIVLSIFGGLFLLYRQRVHRLRSESNIAMALKTLELKNINVEAASLRRQMNPHFIFNVLSSIQRYVLKEDKQKASKLLTRFSKLIRSSLENSRLAFVSLQSEIDFLDNYVKIEQERFPGRFDFTLEVDDLIIEKNIKLPPLLIQPLLENAIKHAFIVERGNLQCKISLNSLNTLLVQVIDDGVGFNKKVKSQTENSLGLIILKQRLELLNNQGYHTTLKVSYQNKLAKKGTKVSIIIPYQ